MPERLRAILQRVLDWWNKFTTVQKTMIVGGAAAVLVTIGILVTVLTAPKYVTILNANSTKEASEVTSLFDSNSITYKVSNDGLQIKVLEQQQSTANLLMGANSIQSLAYSIDNVTNGGFATTESDKQKKYVLYLESRLEEDFIKNFDAVKSAKVQLTIPDDNGTLIANEQEASAWINLELSDPAGFTADNASFLAKAVAVALGNKTTTGIVITDTAGNMLFSGAEDSSSSGLASTQLGVKAKAEQQLRTEVSKVLLGTSQYDSVEVASNLILDFSEKETTTHDYTPADGQTQGVLSHESLYNAENVNGVSGIPGTDSNQDDETTYVTQDNNNSTSTVTEEQRDYLPNEKIVTEKQQPGKLDYAQSSISVTAITYNIMNEEDYVAADHDNLTWDQYKVANNAPVQQEVPEDITNIIAKATGLSTDNIAMTAYTENVFYDKQGMAFTVTDILQIVLILIILGLLAFVVLRSMRTQKRVQEAEEPQPLSVEQLLESQPADEQLENIEIDQGSETKHLIEKFVEENPEAAANLLRNWLNEDYS